MASINSLEIKLNKLADIDLEKMLNKAGIIVENSAKEKCPVDTGQLRQSITHETSGDTCTVGTNVEYAPYVEFGTGLFSSQGNGRQDVPWRYQDAEGKWHTTKGQHPQPFLAPALEENKDAIIEMFKESIKEELK